MMGGTLFGLYTMYVDTNPEIRGFAKGFAIMLIWISYFLVQMPLKLRNIEAKANGVLVDNKQLIEYKDIIWLTKFDITAPYFITIKYRDKATQMDKKIAYLPNQRSQKMIGEDKLTVYIKNMVKESKPNFIRESEPSAMKNFIFIMLLSLPFTLLTLYFINETYHFF